MITERKMAEFRIHLRDPKTRSVVSLGSFYILSDTSQEDLMKIAKDRADHTILFKEWEPESVDKIVEHILYGVD